MYIYVRPHWTKLLNLNLTKCSKGYPFQQLSLQDIGTHINRFLPLRLSYNNLPIDPYLPNKPTIPNRFRKFTSFQVEIEPEQFKFTPLHNYQFSQKVDDFRKHTRHFQPMDNYVLDRHFFFLMTQIIGLSLLSSPDIKTIELAVHQVRLLSYPNIPSDNAPEGIHQDGADYIVSALIINKHNIQDADSIIYDTNKKKLYQKQLELGEFIFQEDKHLWHDITPIKTDSDFFGYRDILGFDLKIID